jgi:hypothetical protein
MFLLSPASGPGLKGDAPPGPPCSKTAFPASWVTRSESDEGKTTGATPACGQTFLSAHPFSRNADRNVRATYRQVIGSV